MSIYNNIAEWAEARNLVKGSTPQAQFLKLSEELGEVAAVIAKGKDDKEFKSEVGDMLVVLTILAAQRGVTLGECASVAYDKIKHRKGRMENGVFIKEGAYHPSSTAWCYLR
jgi:NTP pyrophosphatase (non-canonical NTP hydrolase)